jgi:hypothetical protein
MIVSRRVALALGGVTVAAVVGTAGVAAAAGSSGGPERQVRLAAIGTAAPSPSAGTSGSPSGKAADRRAKHPGRLARGLHGEFVAKGKDGKFVTVVTVRGTVTAVSPTSVTFKAEDGYTATFGVGADSKVRGKDVDAIGDVKVGDTGGAAGTKSADGITARTIVIRHK